jgi:hypothetical protein
MIVSHTHTFSLWITSVGHGHKLQILSQPSGTPSPRKYVLLCDSIYPNYAERTVHTVPPDAAVRSQVKQLVYTRIFLGKADSSLGS